MGSETVPAPFRCSAASAAPIDFFKALLGRAVVIRGMKVVLTYVKVNQSQDC
jgi:hypothetical protein